MKVNDYERQQELDQLRWKTLIAAAAVTADIMRNRISPVPSKDLDDELDAAVCAYAAKIIEPVTCKACGQVIKPGDEQVAYLSKDGKVHNGHT